MIKGLKEIPFTTSNEQCQLNENIGRKMARVSMIATGVGEKAFFNEKDRF